MPGVPGRGNGSGCDRLPRTVCGAGGRQLVQCSRVKGTAGFPVLGRLSSVAVCGAAYSVKVQPVIVALRCGQQRRTTGGGRRDGAGLDLSLAQLPPRGTALAQPALPARSPHNVRRRGVVPHQSRAILRSPPICRVLLDPAEHRLDRRKGLRERGADELRREMFNHIGDDRMVVLG